MPRTIDGVVYLTATDVQRLLQVSRTTLWRWRTAGLVPAGMLFREKQVLYTEREVERIRDYAQRMVPAQPTSDEQLDLFVSRADGRR